MKRILIVEDDLAFGTMIQTWLKKKGFDVERVTSVGAAIKAMGAGDAFHLVLSDLRLPDHDGLVLLQHIRKSDAHLPFIVMTSYAEVQNAVCAMKSGATDYVAKPFHPEILLEKIREAIQSAASAVSAPQRAESAAMQDAPQEEQQGATEVPRYIKGESEASKQLYEFVSLVAPTPMSVLILGASGTGKEYVARSIHEQSLRKDKPFYAIDCGAIPKEVAASEFFGYKKGAFTGAEQDKKGAFEIANGGTVFLDEMGNLNYEVQVQLLRALQERKIRPLGSTQEIDVDIRLIKDSIHLSDSLKYYTLRKHRVVYGGGGIMPDYFVPLDTTKYTKMHRQLAAKSIVINHSLKFIDAHRKELKSQYKDFDKFLATYEVPSSLIDGIIAEGKKEKTEPKDEAELIQTKKYLALQLKALVARDIWDMSQYFQVWNETNEIVQRAVQLLTTGK